MGVFVGILDFGGVGGRVLDKGTICIHPSIIHKQANWIMGDTHHNVLIFFFFIYFFHAIGIRLPFMSTFDIYIELV